MVKHDDLPVTLPQAGKRATQNLILLTTVAEIKGIGIVTRQKRCVNGRLNGDRRRWDGPVPQSSPAL